MRERLITVTALAPFDALMDVDVFLVFVLIGKRFVTVLALIFANFPVYHVHVLFQDGDSGKLSVAFLAWIIFVMITIVGPHKRVSWRHIAAFGFLTSSWIARSIFETGRQIVGLFDSSRVDRIIRIVLDHVFTQIDRRCELGRANLTRMAQ